jgi:hypothetical protein
MQGSELEELKFFLVITSALSLRSCELFNIKKADVLRVSDARIFTVRVELRDTKTVRFDSKVTECIFESMSNCCPSKLPHEPMCAAHALWDRRERLADDRQAIFLGGRINARLKQFALTTGLNCRNLTAHSGHRTGTQKLLARGVGEQEIQVGTGWKTADMVGVYGSDRLKQKARGHARTILLDK